MNNESVTYKKSTGSQGTWNTVTSDLQSIVIKKYRSLGSSFHQLVPLKSHTTKHSTPREFIQRLGYTVITKHKFTWHSWTLFLFTFELAVVCYYIYPGVVYMYIHKYMYIYTQESSLSNNNKQNVICTLWMWSVKMSPKNTKSKGTLECYNLAQSEQSMYRIISFSSTWCTGHPLVLNYGLCASSTGSWARERVSLKVFLLTGI